MSHIVARHATARRRKCPRYACLVMKRMSNKLWYEEALDSNARGSRIKKWKNQRLKPHPRVRDAEFGNNRNVAQSQTAHVRTCKQLPFHGHAPRIFKSHVVHADGIPPCARTSLMRRRCKSVCLPECQSLGGEKQDSAHKRQR